MGNLKISKAKKNKNSRGSSGIPNWLLSTLVILVVLAVIATCAISFINSNGIVMRYSTAMEYGNYKVNGNMMSYFYQTTYMNFVNNYSAYMSYFSFDQNTDPKLQQFNPEGYYDSAFLGEFEGTWYDYFMSQTVSSVENLLIYCNEADKLGITLDEVDETEIEASLETLLINIRTQYGAELQDSKCLALVYGEGINKNDIRKAMKLSSLASKVSQKISDDIEAGITDEKITTTYDENKLDFNLIDAFSYSFDVYYSDVVSEKYSDKKAEDLDDDEKAVVLALYKEKIATIHKAAEELKTMTTLEEFQNWVIDYTVNDSYDDEFKGATEGLGTDKKPSDADLATIKNKIIEAVIKEVKEGKDTVTDDVVTTEVESEKTYTIYDISISADFAEDIKTVKSKLFTSATSAKTKGLSERTNYIAPDSDGHGDDFSEWAFSSDRKANDTINLETGDGANGAELTASTDLSDSFTAEVSILLKTSYRDETLSRNVAYMLFTDETAAKTAIEAIGAAENLDKDRFLEIANDENNPSDASTFLEDYIIGNMQSDEFDEWLFAAKNGEFTKTAIEMSDGSFMVALYVDEGDIPAWKNTVKVSIYNDEYMEYENNMIKNASVTINYGVINKVGA